jgi:hypothetical protein
MFAHGLLILLLSSYAVAQGLEIGKGLVTRDDTFEGDFPILFTANRKRNADSEVD